MYEKPELPSAQKRELCNKIYIYIYGVLRTKEEICFRIYGEPLNATRDRNIRDAISEIKKRKPIYSPSSGKGYMAIASRSDVEKARHQIAEYRSRIADFEASIEPLERFVEGR